MTVRLGVIGCGEHAQHSHVKVMGSGAVVTAIYDPKRAARRELLRLTAGKVAVCKSARGVVGRPDVDAVLIMTPDDTHPELLELVVNAGKPVLCEKPLATTEQGMACVKGALRHAERHGIHVASCHMRRATGVDDLPYGWLATHIAGLERHLSFGPLERIQFISNYPHPTQSWKRHRSFLADKVCHDLDILRAYLGDLPFTARRLMDSYDHYEVDGSIHRKGRPIQFVCLGMRLHSARGEFIEIVQLNFQHGSCTVYTKTGLVRYHTRSGLREEQITPMNDEAYQRGFASIMANFVGVLEGTAQPLHTPHDLLVVNEAVVGLAETGRYNYLM
jgi:predicted dehydrogenase